MMNYDQWIARERRIRVKILMQSPLQKERYIYRVCNNCNEICICYEERCPNCNSDKIIQKRFNEKKVGIDENIRCRYRYDHLPCD